MQSDEPNYPAILETSASEEDVVSAVIEDSESGSDNDNNVEPNNSFDAHTMRERTSSVIIHDVPSMERKLTPRSKSPIFGENADNSLKEKLSPRIKSELPNESTPSKVDETFDESSDDTTSDSEDSDSDSDVENLPIEEKLERERVKSARANDTISALLQQITQYKTAIEGEQAALENQMKEERGRWKKEEKILKSQAAKLEKQVENLNLVLNQTAAHYESKLQELEEEKTTRSKETIENLQTLIRELNYIEEVNEDLTRQLERESNNKKHLQEELHTSKQLIDQLTSKVASLEEENLAISTKTGKGFREVMHLVSPRGHTNSVSPASPGKESDTGSLALELNKVKMLYAQAVQDLEKERTKIQSIDLLVNQMKILTAPSVTSEFTSNQSGEAEEKRVLLKKLLEEKEAHSHTLQTLNDERKKSQNDREYMESLSQRIKDLIQSHSNTLKQLEEERDNVRKGKDIVKDLQAEIKSLKSEKKGKLLILNSEKDGGIEVSPLMSEDDDNKSPIIKPTATKPAPNTSDGESSGKNSPTVGNSRVYVPELRLESTGPEIKPLRPGMKSKFPPAGNRPAFYSLRHKKSHSTGYFPEFIDDSNISNFDLSDLPQSVSGAKIRATLRKALKQQKEEVLATPDIRTPEIRTPEVRSPRTPRDGPDSPRDKIDTRPRDGSMTERTDRDKSRFPSGRRRSNSRSTKEDKHRPTSLAVPKLNIPIVDEKDKLQLRMAQSAREPSSDERTDDIRPKLTKGKYESDSKLSYTPRQENPFLDLINEKESEKKKKKEKKAKKEKKLLLTDRERKGSIGSASVDSMPNPSLSGQPVNRMRRNTMDKKLWAQMLSSGFY